MQAPGEPEQHLPTARRAPSRIAVLEVGALSDDAVALALAHQSAHSGRSADPGDQTHGLIVAPRGPRMTGAGVHVVVDGFDEQLGVPTTNRDQSCAFCGRSHSRLAHLLDRMQKRDIGAMTCGRGARLICNQALPRVCDGS